MASDSLKEWRQDPANKNLSTPGDDRSPAWTWQTYLYHDGKNLSFPSANLMVCLRQAGTQMILKRQKTFKEITQSGMLVHEEYLRLTIGGKAIPLAKIRDMEDLSFAEQFQAVLFVKRAKVGQSKHVRVRARLNTWEISGNIDVIAAEITTDRLVELFHLAERVGLGDWRPGGKTPGPYGMFKSEVQKL
jgi:hypothetical protein